MAREERWLNQDGLAVGFGTRTQNFTESRRHPAPDGPLEKVVLKIRGEDLADAVAVGEDQIVNGVVIPAGATLIRAEILVTEAFVGATAVLDVGTYDQAGAVIDDDGIVAAQTVASLTLGAEIAGAGAALDTVVGAGGVKIAASYDTAAFTAGEAQIVVEYATAS